LPTAVDDLPSIVSEAVVVIHIKWVVGPYLRRRTRMFSNLSRVA